MLPGDDDGVKPDRMVLRWLASQAAGADASEAGSRCVESLSSRSGKCHDAMDGRPCRLEAGRLLINGERTLQLQSAVGCRPEFTEAQS